MRTLIFSRETRMAQQRPRKGPHFSSEGVSPRKIRPPLPTLSFLFLVLPFFFHIIVLLYYYFYQIVSSSNLLHILYFSFTRTSLLSRTGINYRAHKNVDTPTAFSKFSLTYYFLLVHSLQVHHFDVHKVLHKHSII